MILQAKVKYLYPYQSHLQTFVSDFNLLIATLDINPWFCWQESHLNLIPLPGSRNGHPPPGAQGITEAIAKDTWWLIP